MTLKEYCRNKIEISILRLAAVFLLLSFFFSASIYLKKVNASLQENLKQIEMVKAKINRADEIKKYIYRISIPESKTPEISMAQIIDTVNSRFPEAKFELSEQKQEGKEIFFSFSLKGDSSFKRFFELISFLQQQSYPACFINSVSLKAKDNLIDFEIKGELRLIK